jgi:hypothetical protein
VASYWCDLNLGAPQRDLRLEIIESDHPVLSLVGGRHHFLRPIKRGASRFALLVSVAALGTVRRAAGGAGAPLAATMSSSG